MDHLPGTGAALIAPWDPSFDDETGIQRGPPLLFHRTQFSCGSVAIRYRISHAVCGADGCLHLYQDLCEIYHKLSRGDIGVLDVPPHIIPMGADWIINCDDQKRATLAPPVLYLPSSKPGEGPAKSTVTSDTSQEQEPPIPITGSYMHYTPVDLAPPKADATCPNDSLSWVSTFEALLASIWQATYRANARFAASKARGVPCGDPLPRSQRPTPSLRTSINVALPSRLDLAGHNKGMVKSHYFPNAVVPVFFTVSDESDDPDGLDMWDAPLWKLARFIHRRMRERDVAHALEVINGMCELPDKRLANVDFTLFAGSFVISDWRQYDIYGERTALDDVEARLAGPPFTEVWAVDGFATFLKAREKGALEDYLNGGIDVRYTVNEAAQRVMGGWLEGVGP